MFDDCPFNYAIAERKSVYNLVKTKNKLKQTLHSFNICQLILMVLYNVYHRHDNFDKRIWTIYLCLIWISVVTTIYLLLWRSDEILEIMKIIDRGFNNLVISENEAVQEILKKRSNDMKQFYRGSIVFHWTFSLFCALTPLAEKNLLLPLYVPFVDEALYAYKTPLFWIIYAYEVFLLYWVMASLMFYICFIVNFIYFGTTMLEVLRYKVRSLELSKIKLEDVEPKKTLNEEILICIKMHLEIKGYIQRVNRLTEHIVFLEMLISAVNLSFVIFVFGFTENSVQVILYFIVVVYNFSAIFVFCLFGDRLTNEGLELYKEIYFTNWYEWKQDTKMLLQFMLQQAQQPIHMNIGKIAPMTLETFKQIGNGTYSYYNLFQRMRS